jgi:MSHA biogenesis protein MshE
LQAFAVNNKSKVSEFANRKRLRLGELLLDAGRISQKQLDEALAFQKKSGFRLGRSLTEVGAILEKDLHQFLAKRLGIDYLDLGNIELDKQIVALLPEVQARRLRALVLRKNRDTLLVGMGDPTDLFAYDELCRQLGQKVSIALVNETELLRTIDIVYRRTDEIAAFAAEVSEELGEDRIDLERLTADADSEEAPVLKLLRSMFRDAVQVKASDIHSEPGEKVLRIRQRVDGVLQEHVLEGRRVGSALVTRLKLMSGLDISEKRLPQDGRFSIRVNESSIDVRVSTLPVQYGEAIVMRLLDQSANLMTMEKLGMPKGMLQRFHSIIARPAGLILVTGPTGSGKTTTLYSALNQVNKATTKIITAEDPVEYRLERVNQVQVHPQIGLDFGRVLRTALRQDPDIILVGEMRDRETVDIGLRAAMTGHLVFSTLHTISAVATANRLFDMGAPGYLIAAALQSIVAQRLVRRVCDGCKEAVEPTVGQSAWLATQLEPNELQNAHFVHGAGCNYCHLTGYRARIGVYELLEMDAGLTDALRREDLTAFNELAGQKKDYVPLVKCALDYATKGVTTVDEVIRVVGGLDGKNFDAVDEPQPIL